MAATAEQQMSLTVAPRGGSSHLNKPARQLVPAFLQKLYEMVNDPSDQDLIRWSETGDSFFVLDQERFSSEVLGRWFKHKNFSSFVRQLNMYGFHKIPHLQQGVLRSDSENEFWNFEHSHFLRGQPDLLCLIQRKRQAPTTANDDAHGHGHGHGIGTGAGAGVGLGAAKDAAGNGAVGALSPNQLLDINTIVNGIQAIKHHQATISADLNELKSSNQHLWQEAMAARERHKKHQDTINRILKFLAGVFGHGDNRMRNDEDATHAVVARKPQRLMIADGRSRRMAEVGDEEEPRSSTASTATASSANPPGSPNGFTDASTPVATDSRPAPQEPRPPSLPTTPSQMQKLLAALSAQSFFPDMLPLTGQHQQHLIAPTPYNVHPQQYAPDNAGQGTESMHTHPNTSLPAPIPATFDHGSPVNALSPFTLSLLGGPPPDVDLFAQQEQDDRLQKTYRTAAEINTDVDELQSNIQSLIQSLGIDPATMDVTPADGRGMVMGVGGEGGSAPSLPPDDASMFSAMNMGGLGSMGAVQDFDFDSFLMDMPRASEEEEGDMDKLAERLDPTTVVSVHKVPTADSSNAGNASSAEQLHAFLDDVASQDGKDGVGGRRGEGGDASFKVPGVLGADPGAGAGARGRKRKSEVVMDDAQPYAPQEVEMMTARAGATPSPIAGGKNKRKR